MNHYLGFGDHDEGLTSQKVWRLFLILLLGFSGSKAFGSEFTYENSIQLKSSVMWRPLSKHIYPPGIPAVLEREDRNRLYKIEQYYNKKVDSNVIKVYVRGPWYRGMLQAYTEEWRNEFLSISKPVCDHNPSFNEEGRLLGYRCVAYLDVERSIPSGALGIAMAYKAGQGEVIHPNAVFWIILPDSRNQRPEQLQKPVSEEFDFKQKIVRSTQQEDLGSTLDRKVVRITKSGGYTLGSGFLVKELGPLAAIFPSQYELANLPCDGIFIVTAAHLFPSGFLSNNDADSFGGFQRDNSLFTHSNVFNIQFNGSTIYRGAATLLAKNEESDVAVLYLNSIGLPATMKEQGVSYCHDIEGLEFSSSLDGGDAVRILGFSSEGGANLISKDGFLAEYPTEDTSNFGPIAKIKLRQIEKNDALFAEDGMSGGPILNAQGKVAGIAIERPVTDNSLIGLDFTSITATAGHDYFRNHGGDPSCVLRFNPFDRTLNLVNTNLAYCDYGNFGSYLPLEPLEGEWVLQEVLTISKSTQSGAARSLGGHVWKNGHSIINGFTIIEGKNILKSGSSLVVNHKNIETINASKMKQGFRLDKKSWASLVPVGVRILYSSELPEDNLYGNDGELSTSPVITGIRMSEHDKSFTQIYSLRNFVVWLRQQNEFRGFDDNICYIGNSCES